MSASVFIASSVEGLSVARAIQANFEHDFECTVWDQGVFTPAQYPLEDLKRATEVNDFAIFVFSADDLVLLREDIHSVVRDNVIFEIGLFTGALGRERCFIVQDRVDDLHIPTDLIGINPVTYSSEGNRTFQAKLGTACNSTRVRINELYQIEYPRTGLHGRNILFSQENEQLPNGQEDQSAVFNMDAVLTSTQSLKVGIECVTRERTTGTYDTDNWIGAVNLPLLREFTVINVPGKAITAIKFLNDTVHDVLVYENGDDQPTWQKRITVGG